MAGCDKNYRLYGLGAAHLMVKLVMIELILPHIIPGHPDVAPSEWKKQNRKVCCTVVMYAMSTVGAVAAIITPDTVRTWIRSRNILYGAVVVLFLVVVVQVIMGFKLSRDLFSTSPGDTAFSALLIGVEIFMLSADVSLYLCSVSFGQTVGSVGITVAICLFIKLCVGLFRLDVTMKYVGGFIIFLFILVIVFAIVLLFNKSHKAVLAYGIFGLVVMTCLLTYDYGLSRFDKTHCISPDFCVYAALNVYSTICNIFVTTMTCFVASAYI